MTLTTATITCGTTMKSSTTEPGLAKITATNTAIFASYLQRSRKNTGPGGTVTATIARLKFEILQGRAGVDALALGFFGVVFRAHSVQLPSPVRMLRQI